MFIFFIFGDSNIYGILLIEKWGFYVCYFVGVCWFMVCYVMLGFDWILIEEGLFGCIMCFVDFVMGDYMNGEVGLKIVLESYGFLDVLIFMLGINDVKVQFGVMFEVIMGGMVCLLVIVNSEVIQICYGGFKMLVICFLLVLVQGLIVDMFYIVDIKFCVLFVLYYDLVVYWGVGFLDVG